MSEIRRGDIVATNHISDNATRRVFHTVDEDAEFYARSREARYDSELEPSSFRPSGIRTAPRGHSDPYFNVPGEGPPDMGWSCVRQVVVVHNNSPGMMTRLHDGSLVTNEHLCRLGVHPYHEDAFFFPGCSGQRVGGAMAI